MQTSPHTTHPTPQQPWFQGNLVTNYVIRTLLGAVPQLTVGTEILCFFVKNTRDF